MKEKMKREIIKVKQQIKPNLHDDKNNKYDVMENNLLKAMLLTVYKNELINKNVYIKALADIESLNY